MNILFRVPNIETVLSSYIVNYHTDVSDMPFNETVFNDTISKDMIKYINNDGDMDGDIEQSSSLQSIIELICEASPLDILIDNIWGIHLFSDNIVYINMET